VLGKVLHGSPLVQHHVEERRIGNECATPCLGEGVPGLRERVQFGVDEGHEKVNVVLLNVIKERWDIVVLIDGRQDNGRVGNSEGRGQGIEVAGPDVPAPLVDPLLKELQ
jgi:hypothetical protein